MNALDRLLAPLAGLCFAALAWLTFQYAPREEMMGEIQRIFYFHAPAGMASLLLLGLAGLLSVIFLFKRAPALDHAIRALIEAGFVMTTLVIVTGPVWAKQAWGAWWTGEPRLTSFLILWVVYAGYLLFRTSTRGARAPLLGAIVSAIAGLDIPLIYIAPTLWNRNHPDPQQMEYSPEIRTAFLFGIFATLLLSYALTRLAYRRLTLEARLAPDDF